MSSVLPCRVRAALLHIPRPIGSLKKEFQYWREWIDERVTTDVCGSTSGAPGWERLAVGAFANIFGGHQMAQKYDLSQLFFYH
jgi:hypothetical protein